MNSPTTLTQYSVLNLTSRQDIENATWTIYRRTSVGVVTVPDNCAPHAFLDIAMMILPDLDRTQDRELELQARKDGRVMILDAAFQMPLIEFRPTTEGV